MTKAANCNVTTRGKSKARRPKKRRQKQTQVKSSKRLMHAVAKGQKRGDQTKQGKSDNKTQKRKDE